MAAFLVRALDYTDNDDGDLLIDDDNSIFEGMSVVWARPG
jgi:hypothetical protein